MTAVPRSSTLSAGPFAGRVRPAPQLASASRLPEHLRAATVLVVGVLTAVPARLGGRRPVSEAMRD